MYAIIYLPEASYIRDWPKQNTLLFGTTLEAEKYISKALLTHYNAGIKGLKEKLVVVEVVENV